MKKINYHRTKCNLFFGKECSMYNIAFYENPNEKVVTINKVIKKYKPKTRKYRKKKEHVFLLFMNFDHGRGLCEVFSYYELNFKAVNSTVMKYFTCGDHMRTFHV